MIPPRTTTFSLISTLDPSRGLLKLSTYTFVKIIILIFWLFYDRFFLLFRWRFLLLSLYWWWLFHFFRFDVFEHDSLQTERVEESPFCQRLNLLWINGANGECPFTHMDNFAILWNLRYLLMRLCNRLHDKLTKITYKNRFSSNIVAIDCLIFSNYSLIAGVDLICFNSYYFSCYWTLRPNFRNARLSYLVISVAVVIVDIFFIVMCLMFDINLYRFVFVCDLYKVARIMYIEGLKYYVWISYKSIELSFLI